MLYAQHFNDSEETMSIAARCRIQDSGCRMQDAGCKFLSCIVNRVSCIKSSRASCIMNQAGFTLVELLITMVVFVLVIAAASQIFTGLLTQFKQQSKIAETNIEGIVGLEILRQDIGHAGYGLPWAYSGTVPGYTEAAAPANIYNDTNITPPRAVLSGNNTGTNGSDYLVIKSVNVARNDPSRKSTRLISTGPDFVRTWTPADENLNTNDRVIVIKGGAGASLRQLVIDTVGATFYTTYGVNGANLIPPWRPSDATDNRIVYGINESGASTPSMPFNRADYYISAANVPARCATGTGVFVKAPVNHTSGTLTNLLPLLDCVADMQVVFGRDTGGGAITYTDDLVGLGLTAQQIREQVREVRVYILAHEGQRDVNYTYPTNPVTVGEFGLGTPAPGFDFIVRVITNWQNYRWKIYTIVVKPENLE